MNESSPLLPIEGSVKSSGKESDQLLHCDQLNLAEAFDLRRNLSVIWANERKENEFAILDGIRSLAFLWVFVCHVHLFFDGYVSLTDLQPKYLSEVSMNGLQGSLIVTTTYKHKLI
jgi:hypothetical protein